MSVTLARCIDLDKPKWTLSDFEALQAARLAPLRHEVKKLDGPTTIKRVLRLKLNVPLVIVITGRTGLLKLFGLPRHTLNGVDPGALRLF